MTTDATAIGSYSVWAIPPDDVSDRIKKVMLGLRDEFGGAPAEIEPHFPIVGSIRMTREDALNKLRTLIQSYPPGCISAFTARVDEIVARPFYYQCVCLRIHYSHQLKEISRCCSHKWGLRFPGVPYLSLLYGKLTEEERKKAQDKVSVLDETITSLSFPVTRLALYKINYKDKTLKSWEKIAELPLQLN
ncbi:cyclic phosphodiesterase [Rosa sericea]